MTLGSPVHFTEGDILFREGDDAPQFYVLLSGRVALEANFGGRQVRIDTLFAGDELGWHERTAAHFAGFAKQQNTSPVPETIPAADEQFNLARSEAAINSECDTAN